ncbi:hypothetical protein BZM27_38820 [Paraburkholderia steynii]|uniref:Uncharacterized protein n=1 Tax=Paraburkholderia steynii TaxID=1245441 RepID=A0A4R0X7A5_9BURK|nr:hypothetical protein BZM27_38820 [Paraburkholderia steynii]
MTAACTSLNGTAQFSKAAPKLPDVNSKLLDAQESLFTHQTQLAELPEFYLEATKELGEVKSAPTEQNRCALHSVACGAFIYRAKMVGAEPEQFVCQTSFDRPKRCKAVPLYHLAASYADGTFRCPICQIETKSANATGGHAPAVLRGDGGPNSWIMS